MNKYIHIYNNCSYIYMDNHKLKNVYLVAFSPKISEECHCLL